MLPPIQGLIAAPHTPFDDHGQLNLSMIERQAEYLSAQGITGVFVCGSTGEGLAMTVEERRQVAERWTAVARGTTLRVIVHVGALCPSESQELAAHAHQTKAHAISCLAPFYYVPASVDALVDYCAQVASAGRDLPFLFYHIPAMTGVRLSMTEFLEKGLTSIPTLSGLKYTDNDLVQLQECLGIASDRLQILNGYDEILLLGLCLGLRAATGSTYNFAAPMYRQLLEAFSQGELTVAAQRQRDAVRLVRLLSTQGFLAASKAMMSIVGIDCGPVRAPLVALTNDQVNWLHDELATQQLIDYIPKSKVEETPDESDSLSHKNRFGNADGRRLSDQSRLCGRTAQRDSAVG